MSAKLTEAQQENLAIIRKAGGTIEGDRRGFHKPGEKATIRGMNAVAVRSLVKLGLLTLTEGTDRNTYAIVKAQRTQSHEAAIAWQRERFGGDTK